jgi:toxin-antitoxin system PIN domain toxin
MTTEPLHLLDANALIALANAGHVHHRSAHRWFAGVRRWATTPITETAFLRLQSNPAVTGRRITPSEARQALVAIRSQPGHTWIPDGSSLAEPVIRCDALIGHRQVTDFHLVNLAATAGAVLATFDSGIRAALLGRDQDLVVLIPV